MTTEVRERRQRGHEIARFDVEKAERDEVGQRDRAKQKAESDTEIITIQSDNEP